MQKILEIEMWKHEVVRMGARASTQRSGKQAINMQTIRRHCGLAGHAAVLKTKHFGRILIPAIIAGQ